MAPARPSLPEGEIHIWRRSLDVQEDLVQSLVSELSLDERERANRFHFERDRRRFIVGRAGLRSILGLYLQTKPSALRFSYSRRGKPSLLLNEGEEPLFFSLSHSHELVMYAFARKGLLGVDVECIRSMGDMDALARRFFSTSESEVVVSAAADEKQKVFFVIWTIKEAYVKATGEGLAGLEDVAVTVSAGALLSKIRVKSHVGQEDGWSVQSVYPFEGYVAAIAAKDHAGAEFRYFEAQPLV